MTRHYIMLKSIIIFRISIHLLVIGCWGFGDVIFFLICLTSFVLSLLFLLLFLFLIFQSIIFVFCITLPIFLWTFRPSCLDRFFLLQLFALIVNKFFNFAILNSHDFVLFLFISRSHLKCWVNASV